MPRKKLPLSVQQRRQIERRRDYLKEAGRRELTDEQKERIRVAQLAWCLLDCASANPDVQTQASPEDWLKVGTLMAEIVAAAERGK